MLRIGEFAALSGISIHMLRNYDKIGLLSPQYIDRESGYRYYDKEQLVFANQIVALKTMGLSLEEIKEINESGNDKLEEILQSKLQEKYRELDRIQEQINQINVVRNTRGVTEDYTTCIVRKTIPSMQVVSLKGQIHTFPEEGILWGKLMNICKEEKIMIKKESLAMSVYLDNEDNQDMINVEVQLVYDNENKSNNCDLIKTIPERDVISVVFKGSYSQIGNINTVVAEWLEKNNLMIQGSIFSIYHNSPGNCENNNDFITELCFPVQAKNK